MSTPDTPDVERGDGISMPPWLAAILRLGAVSAIALFLVWRLTTGIEDRLKGVETSLDLHMRIEVEQSGESAKLIEMIQEHRRDVSEIRQEVRQTCMNTARNDEQRAACLQ